MDPVFYHSLSLEREILTLMPGSPGAVVGPVKHCLLFDSTVEHVNITVIAFGSSFWVCKSKEL